MIILRLVLFIALLGIISGFSTSFLPCVSTSATIAAYHSQFKTSNIFESVFERVAMMRIFSGPKMDLVGAGKGQVVGPWWATKVILNEKQPADSRSSADVGATKENTPTATATETATDYGKAYSGAEIAEQLMAATKELFAAHLQEDGKTVDYDVLSQSNAYQQYCDLSNMLIDVDVGSLDLNARKAFFINTYNSLIWHGMVTFGKPATFNDRLKLYATAAYNIGGMVFSLNDIENGVLRGNRKGAAPLSVTPFPQDDARVNVAVPLDPRIHFALNCGAMSCPPIRFYTAEKVDSQLDVATKGFCNALPIDEAGNLTLSQIFKWYKSDFADSDTSLLRWIANYLKDPKKEDVLKNVEDSSAKVVYEDYDWSTNQSA